MFCPTCGKDNSLDLRYCASCGTNLETVSQALAGGEGDFFTKMDSGMDYFISRYSEHVFRNSPQSATERKVVNSWKILGQAVLTSLVDMILFVLMWNLLPLRALILVISTPFRLLNERAEKEKMKPVGTYMPYELADRHSGLWLGEPPAVTEGTTRHLEDEILERKRQKVITDQLS
jgi:hypothetical protein